MYIYIQKPLLILKKFIVIHTFYQCITAYSSAIKLTCLIPGNVCVQDEGMVKSMFTFVLIQHHVEIIL